MPTPSNARAARWSTSSRATSSGCSTDASADSATGGICAGAVAVIVALATAALLARSMASKPVPADTVVPNPAPAAAGSLAYILDGDVYVADLDGSDAVKIADGRGDDCGSTDGFSFWAEGSMWSPDGRYLAYRRVDCSVKKPGIEKNWGDVVISDVAGNVQATFPADGWDIGWSPDSSRVAVWDNLFVTVGVYGVDGARQAQIAMPSEWQPSGDHDPAWLRDGTLAVDSVELPLDGSAPGWLDAAQLAEWRDGYSATGYAADSPDGSHTARVDGRSLIVESSDGSGSVRLLTAEPGTSLQVLGFSPQGDRILFSSRVGNARRTFASSLRSVGVDGSGQRLLVAGTMDGDWFVPSLAS